MIVDVDGLTSWLEFSHPSHTIGETFCVAVLPETKVEAKPEQTEMDCAETCSLVWYIGDMSPGYYDLSLEMPNNA